MARYRKRDRCDYVAFAMGSDRPVREAENRLERFNSDRERLLSEVERRVVAKRVGDSKAGGDHSLEYVLNDVAFNEIRRLDGKGNGAADKWKDLSRRLLGMSDEEKAAELRYGRLSEVAEIRVSGFGRQGMLVSIVPRAARR